MPHVVEPTAEGSTPSVDETPIFTEMAQEFPSALGLPVPEVQAPEVQVLEVQTPEPAPVKPDGAEEIDPMAALPPVSVQ